MIDRYFFTFNQLSFWTQSDRLSRNLWSIWVILYDRHWTKISLFHQNDPNLNMTDREQILLDK